MSLNHCLIGLATGKTFIQKPTVTQIKQLCELSTKKTKSNFSSDESHLIKLALSAYQPFSCLKKRNIFWSELRWPKY